MEKKRPRITVRRMRAEDIPSVVACNKAAYTDYPPHYAYDERLYEMQLAAFPEGQFVAVADGRVVGFATSLIVSLDDEHYWYTVDEITGAATFSTHKYLGDTLYGADMAVVPEYRRMGISGMLYERRRRLLKRYNLRRMIAYGRIPGYREYAGRMTADQYVKKVVDGELTDPALNAHIKAGYQVKKVQLDITVDYRSLNYSTYLEMPNPDFNLAKKKIATANVPKRPARRVRVCAAQYQMKPIKAWEEMEESVEFFVDTAASSHCHFLVFPEYFTYQLISCLEGEDMAAMALELAGMASRYVRMFSRFAARYNLYIIGGSTPVLRDGRLYNTAHLFSPTGAVHTQEKLHITPNERNESNIEPGTAIRIFETSLARIAIQVCYDIEFPEISRLLALSGVEIVFVPFYTDEKKAYWRVRHCAHARAVENFVYVVMAGNVGNLRTRIGSFLNYSQSAVVTPSDFPFPERGIQGEADPNVEAVVVAELALSALAQQRHVATVRPLHDRRPDLYRLNLETDIEVVRVE
ncbi:MAG: GNAT family N-acetyltransferase [bacterium]|nr:MAG: GNAT family N-acetyltransferase [bacterium]